MEITPEVIKTKRISKAIKEEAENLELYEHYPAILAASFIDFLKNKFNKEDAEIIAMIMLKTLWQEEVLEDGEEPYQS